MRHVGGCLAASSDALCTGIFVLVLAPPGLRSDAVCTAILVLVLAPQCLRSDALCMGILVLVLAPHRVCAVCTASLSEWPLDCSQKVSQEGF